MKIEKLDNQGRGITYYDNLIMFVKNALPLEDVEVTNIVKNKKHYEAETLNIKKKNKNRVQPKCPFYSLCGGCNLMHMNIGAQEEFKLNKVKSILKKYANLDINVKFIPSDKDLFYRNKITLKVVNKKIGYFNSNTHELCEIDNCLIVNNKINEIIKYLPKFGIINGEVSIRCNYEGKILISIITDDNVSVIDNIPDVVGIVVNNKTIYGDNYFYDYIGDFKFKVSYNSFFQVNNFIAASIFDVLKNNYEGKYLLDLYCGVGTLGLSLKDNYKKIYGIEKNINAIEDAKVNANLNEIKNAIYFAGDTSKVLKGINTQFDTIIIDPPRSGLNQETMDKILEINPQNICYISCDPMTLARDLKILKEKYNISKVTALDMFPNTFHVECVCILKVS